MIRNSYILINLTALLIAAAGRICYAQSTVKVAGIVTDSRTGSPLQEANVQVDGTGSGASTNEWGEFVIENLLEGSYSLTASHIGYKDGTIGNVRITGDQPAELRFSLTPEVIAMPEIRVSADGPEDLPGKSVITLDRKTIDKTNYQSVGELLEQVPGVAIQNSGGIGSSRKISIRGSQPNQVLVLLDGLPLNDQLGGDADLSEIPVNIIEKVEVYRGGISSRFGSGALGGAVNIITRKLFRNRIQIKGSGGSYRFFQIEPNWSAQYKYFGFFGSFNYFGSKGDFPYSYIDSRGSSVEERRINADIKSYNWFLKVHFQKNGHTLALQAQHRISDRGIPGKIDGWTAYARAENKRIVFGAEYRRDAAPLRFSLNCRYAEILSEQSNLIPDDADKRYRRLPQWHYQYSTEHLLLQSALNYTTAPWLRFSLGYSGRILTYCDENFMAFLTPPVNRANDLSNGVYLHQEVQWKIQRFPLQIVLTPVIRWDEMVMTHDLLRRVDHQWSPGLGLTVTTGGLNRIIVKTHYGRSFRAPTFADLFYQDARIEGRPDLAPEKAENFDIGLEAEIRLWGRINAGFTHFHNTIDDLIIWRMGSFEVFRPFNTDAEITGQEVTLELALPGDLISAAFSYSKLNPLNKSENVTTRDRILPYRPVESIKGSLAFNFRGLSGGLRYRHAGKRFVNEANTVSMPAYQTVDCDLSWALTFRKLMLTWKCSVYNLFNERYEILRDMPLPLREWRAGLEFSIQP